MLTVTHAGCHIKAPCGECHYAECHDAECCYAECHGAININLHLLAKEQAQLSRLIYTSDVRVRFCSKLIHFCV